MDSKKLNDWLQVAGLFGVLGGLIFVGLQLSLDRQVAIVQSTESRVAAGFYWAELVSANRELWLKAISGAPLTADEKLSFEALAWAHRNAYFTNHYRAARGLSERTPESFAYDYAREIYGKPGLIQLWSQEGVRGENLRTLEGSPGRGMTNWRPTVNEALRQLELGNSLD